MRVEITFDVPRFLGCANLRPGIHQHDHVVESKHRRHGHRL